MLSFLNRQPPRTKQSHLTTISTEDGRTRSEFFANDPTSTYAMRTTLHPGPTIHTPPYHWHKYQIESFTVESGIQRATLEGKVIDTTAGNTLTIEPGAYHTFDNGSPDQDLVTCLGLDPLERVRDEAFFRNIYCYSNDCRKAGWKPNVCQMCLFLHFFDCYLALPGPRKLAMWVSEWLVWILGVVVGKGLLGMRETYPEYWEGDMSKLKRAVPAQGEARKEL